MTLAAIKGHRSTMNSVSTMVKYFQDKLPKEIATSKIHSGGLTPSYQGSIISILPQEDVLSVCLLLKNRTLQLHFEILKNKIQSSMKNLTR